MLYLVTNNNRNNQWVVATDEKEVIDISIACKFITHRSNAVISTSDSWHGEYSKFFKDKGYDMRNIENKKGVAYVDIIGNKRIWQIDNETK